MMEKIEIRDIARVLSSRAGEAGFVSSVCTDTRKLEPGCLFFALKGVNFDGHDFIGKAFELGAGAAVAEKSAGFGDREILVPDTAAALLRLAGWYRRRFDLPVAAVTGSVGKTTTKDMLSDILSRKYKTLKNEGNQNNEIGLPMTVFNLDSTYEAAVFEMGMSARGEIGRLSGTAAPSLAVITNIGVSHIETLGSKDNILAAKLEVMDGMSEGSALIVNLDDELLAAAACGGMKKIGFALKNPLAQYRAAAVEKTQTGVGFTAVHPGGETPVSLPVHGLHNVYNALAAFAAGCEAGVEPALAAKALGCFSPTGMRQKMKTAGGVTYIEDCYNAGPDSQRAALLTLAGIQAKRKIAVLGDMLELGAIADREHKALGVFAAAQGIDILLTFGPLSEYTAAAARSAGVKQVFSFDTKTRLASALAGLLEPGDAVLFKASRGMKLEEAIHLVYKEMKVDE